MERNVLVADCDRQQTKTLRTYLEGEGFRTVEADDGLEALSLVMACRPVCVLLDQMLPLLNGLEVCQRIRQRSTIPVVLLSIRRGETDRLNGFAMGADDYIVKPFSPREVLARIKALLRRCSQHRGPVGRIDGINGLSLDPDRFRVSRNGSDLDITRSEFMILQALITSPGRVFSREKLLEAIYPQSEVHVLDRIIDVHIRNLRKKIEEDPAKPTYIQTIRGIGYRFSDRCS